MKRYIAVILGFLLIFWTSCFCNSDVYAANASTESLSKANTLKSLGLFLGYRGEFGLDEKVSKVQGAVILVRLLGIEKEAKQFTDEQPYSDVPAWADRYIAYLYNKGMITGISGNKFGANDDLQPSQFVAFLLRALGYDSIIDNFKWDNSIEKATKVGLLSWAEGKELEDDSFFTRGDAVDFLFIALKIKMKDSDKTLIQKLVEDNKCIQLQTAQDSGLYTAETLSFATGIVIDKQSLRLKTGQTGQLEAKLLPDNIKASNIMWKSNDENIVKVSQDGIITAISPGEAVVIALCKDDISIRTECMVVVTSVDAPAVIDVTVSTPDELVAAISSNKRILLEPGIYDLSKVSMNTSKSGDSVRWEEVYDGKEVNIENISNLTIEGLEKGKVEIRTTPRYAYIMNFRNANNVTIKNIIAGHEPQKYTCDAGVLKFTDSTNISIYDSDLYGCGSMGLDLKNVKYLSFNKSIIRECSLRAMQIYDSEFIRFTESSIINHTAYSNIILLSTSKDIIFKDCELANNNSFEWSFIESSSNLDVAFDGCYFSNNSPFYVGSKTPYFLISYNNNAGAENKILIRDSVFSNNRCNVFADNINGVTIENCMFKNNDFVDNK